MQRLTHAFTLAHLFTFSKSMVSDGTLFGNTLENARYQLMDELFDAKRALEQGEALDRHPGGTKGGAS